MLDALVAGLLTGLSLIVAIGAEQMIAYTNFFVADTSYPGVTTEVVPAEEVSFA